MGVVYKARQRGLDRVVAVKVLPAGPAPAPEEVRRFHTEARLAARLRHPHIVAIHEVATHDGRPFFSMDFVDGASLADRIRSSPLPADRVARYLVAIAEAVHFAHENGVLHRDLKPANILIDGQDRPLVSDFGLARPLADDRGLTAPGAVVGTASYMAPEQAAGAGGAVTPAADVYGLGATLYEALTGRPPFLAATAWETLALVRSDDPVPPRRLQPRVPRDLETICLKCLRKSPRQRYASARAVGEDLQRYLRGEPVAARPVSPRERLGRWCRRQPVVAALTATLALGGAGSLAGLTALWVRAERQRALASDHAARESAQRQLAEQNLRAAAGAVNQYLTQVSQEHLLDEPFMKPLRHKLLNLAQGYYQEFATRYGGDPALRAERGLSLLRLAEITAEIDSKPKAIAYAEQARDVLSELARDDPAPAPVRRHLAKAYNVLGTAHHALGQAGAAEAAYDRAAALLEGVTRDCPGDAEARADLASCCFLRAAFCRAQTRYAEAERAARQALAIRADLAAAAGADRDSQVAHAQSLNQVAALCFDQGRFSDAEGMFLASAERWATLAGSDARSTRYGVGLANAHNNLGLLYIDTARHHLVEDQFQRAIDVLSRIGRDHPEDAAVQLRLTDAYENLGTHFTTVARPDRAEAALQSARAIAARLVRDHAEVVAFRNVLARVYLSLGDLYATDASRGCDAEAAFLEARGRFRGIVRENPGRQEFIVNLGSADRSLANLYRGQRRYDESMACYSAAARAYIEVIRAVPQHSAARRFLREVCAESTRVHQLTGRPNQALAVWDGALAGEAGAGRNVLRLYRAQTLAHLGRYAEAAAEVDAASAFGHTPADDLVDAATILAGAAGAVRGDVQSAERYGAAAVDLLRRALGKGYDRLAHLKADVHLASLRSRPDFIGLIGEMERRINGR
jgi:serine/threonine-protein kinase